MSEEGHDYQEIEAFRITSQVKAGKVKRLHYMAFVEATEKGTPHLHILLRTKYIPQRWLSQQMQELINSPIVWVEKIKGASGAIKYVTKYVTDAPAQYGKSRRYWTSRFYRLITKQKPETPLLDRKHAQRVRMDFREFLLDIIRRGSVPVPMERQSVRVYSLKDARRLFSDGVHWEVCPELAKASLWLARWKREAAIVRWEHG